MSVNLALKKLDDERSSLIFASPDPKDGIGEICGHVDKVEPASIVGWAQAKSSTNTPLTVVFSFGRHLISSLQAKGHRADIEDITGNAEAGFELSFKDPSIRASAIKALASYLAQKTSDDSAEEQIELSICALDAAQDFDAEIYMLDGTPNRRRTLQGWLEFFDVDEHTFADLCTIRCSDCRISPKPSTGSNSPVVIAFYLPQFHPTAQNDKWWGPGFTEWTSVATAKSYFSGHIAPNVPADFGFYDVRLKEVRAAQADLAKLYGIYGFCYYFYWFSGQRILERPLELLLQDREPELPYCLCWANETWSRRWDGSEAEILQHQTHDTDVDLSVIDDLLPFFDDQRYIRIDGKPLLLIYRITLMPNPVEFIFRLRKKAIERGLPGLYICAVRSFGITDGRVYGADSSVEFPPHGVTAKTIDPAILKHNENFHGTAYDYRTILEYQVSDAPDNPYFPGVMPRWDNTPRKKETGNVYHYSSPSVFEAWVRIASRRTLKQNPDTPLLFVNSWNEWGEGAHLEPDMRYGRAYLEALRRGTTSIEGPDQNTNVDSAFIQSIRKENSFISNRLASIGRLQSGIAPLSGSPAGLINLSHENRVGEALDLINGFPSMDVFALRKDDDLYLKGWFVGSKHSSGVLYILLDSMQDKKRFFAPVVERYERIDVSTHLELASKDHRAGFVLSLSTANLERGIYTFRFIEASNETVYHSSIKRTLEIW